MAIKILVISNYNDPISSRPEAEVFLGLDKTEFQITVMTYKGSEYAQKFEENGIRVIDFHPQSKFNKKEIDFIRQELITGKYDILQLFNSKSIVSGIRAAKGIPVKVVLYRGTVSNVHWWDPTCYLKFLHPRVDKIICNSKGVEDEIRRNLFFNKDKCITINKGHRLEWYENYTPINLQDEGVPEEAFVVSCVGNNRRVKGVPYLLKAFNYLPKDLPIHLILVGRDMDNEENLQIINTLDYKNNIHVKGFRSDGLNLVASSDTLVLASLFGESLNKSVMEAMALGKAPIITDLPGNAELVDNNENGIIVPVKDSKAIADAIYTLYKNKELCKEYGRKSKERVKTVLNSETTIKKTAQMYRELVN